MQLFLSSHRFGSHGNVLREMVGEDGKVGVITNAKDYKNLEERTQSVQSLFSDFIELGLVPQEIDLRSFFGQPELLQLELQKYSLVWLSGGNCFVLRRALKASGADGILINLVREGSIAYGGESAGAMVAAPLLDGMELVDDPSIVPEGYLDEDIVSGLGLVPYTIVPHFGLGHEGVDRAVERLEEEMVPYKTLTDDEVLVIDDSDAVVLS